jgi:hypothetical protein
MTFVRTPCVEEVQSAPQPVAPTAGRHLQVAPRADSELSLVSVHKSGHGHPSMISPVSVRHLS